MNKLYFILILISITSCSRKSNDESSASASFIDGFELFPSAIIKIDSTLINNFNNEDLKLFYKHFNNETVWTSETKRKYVLEELLNADKEGLESKDYQYSILQSYENDYSKLADSSLVNYDLLLTKNLQLYTNHVGKGKLKASDVYNDWDLKENIVDVNSLLFDAIEHDNLKITIEKTKPNHIIYKKLKLALQQLVLYPKDSIDYIVLGKDKILPNKKYKIVYTIKRRLMYWNDLKHQDTLTGIYDAETQQAMKVFQARHGLNPDAIIGKATIEALNYTKNHRIEQVIANLERWRWFKHDFGKNYLLINIPDYSIVAVKDTDTMQAQRIVVGKESRRTPILESKISNINLNPNWTVPPTILKEDIFPDAIKNKGAFRKKGLVIMNYKNQEINPYSWKIADAKKYKYVQKPSRNNSLGSMKINFPNKHSVYLHDTNHRDYFNFTFRSLSSGCVRLEKPLEMASYLINDEEKWDLQTIKDTTDINYYIKLKKDKELKLAQKNAKLLAKNPELVIAKKVFARPELKTIVIPINEEILIHQLYWTAWMTNGKLQFREDIYCSDHQLYAMLRN
ncbi:murein L,D-transpeptidase [Flavobacterium sp.]|uniref:L,D-transpeptidase family protein n=1 Tax=Flavobacterium sp. TaxID=239 RepID=UPI003753E059